MRRTQINLTLDSIGLNSLKTGLTRYLIGHDVASVEVVLEDDRLSISASIKKPTTTIANLSGIAHDISKYVSAQYGELVVHVADGVGADNNKLEIICAFEVDE